MKWRITVNGDWPHILFVQRGLSKLRKRILQKLFTRLLFEHCEAFICSEINVPVFSSKFYVQNMCSNIYRWQFRTAAMTSPENNNSELMVCFFFSSHCYSVQAVFEIQVHRPFVEARSWRIAQVHCVRHANTSHHLEIRRKRRASITNVSNYPVCEILLPKLTLRTTVTEFPNVQGRNRGSRRGHVSRFKYERLKTEFSSISEKRLVKSIKSRVKVVKQTLWG